MRCNPRQIPDMTSPSTSTWIAPQTQLPCILPMMGCAVCTPVVYVQYESECGSRSKVETDEMRRGEARRDEGRGVSSPTRTVGGFIHIPQRTC